MQVGSLPLSAFVPPPPPTAISFPVNRHMVKTEHIISELGLTLPPAPTAAANYQPCQRVDNVLYLSGHLPLRDDGTLHTGTLGKDYDVQAGYQAARQVGLNLIASLKHELGDLDRVEKIVKLFGIVQSTNDFHEQHKVVNGCSDLFCEVFGKERGMHARSAIGTNALPLGIAVEIEAIVLVRDTST